MLTCYARLNVMLKRQQWRLVRMSSWRGMRNRIRQSEQMVTTRIWRVNHRGNARATLKLTVLLNALKHHYLPAKIKSHQIVFEEAVADVHLKVLLVVAGSGRPENRRGGLD